MRAANHNALAFTCPCGCALQLSPSDLGKLNWLNELSGFRTGNEMLINLTSSKGDSLRFSLFAPEPTKTLECRCGADVEVAVYIADFLDRWGMGEPNCERCHRKQNA
jgi:hypothetical protein